MMNKKFTQFLNDIKYADSVLIESIYKAYKILHEDSETKAQNIQLDMNRIGSVPETILTDKILSDELSKTDFYNEYVNFTKTTPSEGSVPEVDFINTVMQQPDIADKLNNILASVDEKGEILENTILYIKGEMTIEQYSDYLDRISSNYSIDQSEMDSSEPLETI